MPERFPADLRGALEPLLEDLADARTRQRSGAFERGAELGEALRGSSRGARELVSARDVVHRPQEGRLDACGQPEPLVAAGRSETQGIVDGSVGLGEAPELHQADRDLDRQLCLPLGIIRNGTRALEQVDPRCEVGPIQRPDTRGRQMPDARRPSSPRSTGPSSASSRLDCSRW